MENTVNERLKMLLDTQTHGNKSKLAKAAGVAGTTIGDLIEGRKGNPSFGVIENLLRSFPNISPAWLMLGEGPMLKSQPAEAADLTSGEATVSYATKLMSHELMRELIDGQKETISDLRATVAFLKEELGKFLGSPDAAGCVHAEACHCEAA